MPEPTRPKVAMLLYPGLTPLDLIAPHAAFAGPIETHLVWKTTDPVRSDSGVVLLSGYAAQRAASRLGQGVRGGSASVRRAPRPVCR